MTDPGVDLRHLETFVAVAETLHFGRAAHRLHLAQPAVSHHIGRLEAVLGTRLFDRNHRTTTLTDAGRAFLPEARRALSAVGDAVAVARAAARGQAGRLRVAVAPSAAGGRVLEALRATVEAAPGLALEVRELRQRDVVEALRRQDADLGVGAVLTLPPQDTGIAWRAVARESFVVALPAGHALAALPGPLSLADLDGEPFVSFSRDDGTRYDDTLRDLLTSAAVAPGRESIVRERLTQLALVGAGLGIALVPASTAALRTGDVSYRDIAEPTPPLTTIAAWRADDANPVLHRVLGQLPGEDDPGPVTRRATAGRTGR